MRIIKLDESSFTPGTVTDEGTLLTGQDELTGDLTSVVIEDATLVATLSGLVSAQGAVSLPVAEFQVVDTQPVRGEWDSPGTSPEDDA
jgi:hypothetical protein